jgi:hypothetical protein
LTVSLSQQVEVSVIDESPRLGLAPSATRVEAIDQELRDRLAGSFRYLADFAGLDDNRRAGFANLEARLGSGPVSPWVFGLYAKLVAALAAQPRGDVSGDFDAVLEAASLRADLGVVAFSDPAFPPRGGTISACCSTRIASGRFTPKLLRRNPLRAAGKRSNKASPCCSGRIRRGMRRSASCCG